MSTEPQLGRIAKSMHKVGWALTVLVVAGLVFSASMKLIQSEGLEKGAEEIGWKVEHLYVLGFVELACALIYLFPTTAVLGAILVTGYAGGAIATHARLEQNFVGPIVLGVLTWLALFLRDRRIRSMLPFWFGY